MSFVQQAITRIRREGWALLPYTFGRFHTVRTLYSAQSRVLHGHKKLNVATTMFPDIDIEQAVSDIRTNAVHLPVMLPPEVVTELRHIAETAQLEARTNDVKHHFYYSDVKQAHLPNGELVLMGRVSNIEQFPIADRIAADSVALSVMTGYLGYTPTKWEARMFWSFASDAALAARKKAGQTTQFHFDVHSYNFAYAAYYILDTDRTNGAHVMIEGSHKDKPTAWLFGSANQPDETIYAHYPKDKVLIIEGKAGTGFWQDSSCYRKALPPDLSDRLLFQVRYF